VSKVTNKEIMDKLEFIEEMVMAIIEHFNVPRVSQPMDQVDDDAPVTETFDCTLIADSEGYINEEYLKKTGTKL